MTALFAGLSIGSVFVLSDAAVKLNDHSNSKGLLQKLRQGTVNEKNQTQMQRFTDFLNQHGRLVNLEND